MIEKSIMHFATCYHANGNVFATVKFYFTVDVLAKMRGNEKYMCSVAIESSNASNQ